jgi:Ca2+-binding RTX toxin-like protein
MTSTRRFTVKGKSIVIAVVAALVLAAGASAAALDVIRGTDGPDNLNGTGGADLIYGRGGNDVIRGHDGGDVIYGGQGNDVVRGGPGNDVIYGGQSTGDGNDILHALANDNQPDVLNCGPGYDIAFVIVHDPARFHGCEQIVRLTPEEAAATAAANDDNG